MKHQKNIYPLACLLVIIAISLFGCSSTTASDLQSLVPNVPTGVPQSNPMYPAQDIAPSPTASNETLSQKNAIAAAKSYLNIHPLSYSELIKQLEYDGFTTEQVEYAASQSGLTP